jgi:hypothetical protein
LPLSFELLIAFKSFQGVTPSPIFSKFLSIAKPGSPLARIGLFFSHAVEFPLLN